MIDFSEFSKYSILLLPIIPLLAACFLFAGMSRKNAAITAVASSIGVTAAAAYILQMVLELGTRSSSFPWISFTSAEGADTIIYLTLRLTPDKAWIILWLSLAFLAAKIWLAHYLKQSEAKGNDSNAKPASLTLACSCIADMSAMLIILSNNRMQYCVFVLMLIACIIMALQSRRSLPCSAADASHELTGRNHLEKILINLTEKPCQWSEKFSAILHEDLNENLQHFIFIAILGILILIFCLGILEPEFITSPKYWGNIFGHAK